MDDAVYTFETLLHQELGKTVSKDELCKTIQRILERVLKVWLPLALRYHCTEAESDGRARGRSHLRRPTKVLCVDDGTVRRAVPPVFLSSPPGTLVLLCELVSLSSPFPEI